MGLDAPIGTTTYCCDDNYICVYCYICVWIFTYAWGYFSYEIDRIAGYAENCGFDEINDLCYIGQHHAVPEEHAFHR